MSSDEKRFEMVREALAVPATAFHSSLAATLEEVHRDAPADHAHGSADNGVDLGSFAKGRIDAGRFAALVEERRVPEGEGADGLRLATETLADLEARGDDMLHVDVPAGRSLHEAVDGALADVGRAFGAARVVERVRAGQYAHGTDDADLLSMPFSRWGRAERLRAPPLVVGVAGAALHADALAEFLDGHVRIVLVVSGPAPPAPLARLISPGTFVLQTTDGSGLDRLVAWDGPGIAALVPEGAARFVHDPAAGKALAERLSVDHLPAEAPTRPVGGISVSQQRDQLDLLSCLATPPTPSPAPLQAAPSPEVPAVPTEPQPADRLAAWLLDNADLTDMP